MSTDALDRLREAHADVPAPDAAATALAAARLEAAMGAGRGGRSTRRVLALAAVLAVAAVIAAALLPTPHGTGPARVAPGPAPAVASACAAGGSGSPSSCLQALGAVAGAQPSLANGVRYQRNHWQHSLAHFGPSGSGAPPEHRTAHAFDAVRWTSEELWLAPDGSGRLAYGNEEPAVFPTSADRRAWRRSGSPDLARLYPPGDNWGPKVTSFSAHEADSFLLGNSELYGALPKGHPLDGMPRDPAALRRYLMRTAWFQRTKLSGEGPCAQDLHDCSEPTRRNIRAAFGSDILTLLRYPYSPPDLRRALFAVLSGLPGTRLLGPLRDPAGRRAVAIQVPRELNDGLGIVAFDPRRAALIAVGTSDEPRSSEIRWSTLYAVASGVVDKVGERPRR